MDASIPEPTPWPTSPWGKTALFNNRPRREEIARRQFLFFGKSVAKFTIKLAAGRPKKIRQIPPRNAVYSMPALRKCPFAPLDKWPAEPLFWAEATRSFEVQAACWMKVKELHQPEEVIRKRGTGKFKELYNIEEPRQGGLVVPFRSVLGEFLRVFQCFRQLKPVFGVDFRVRFQVDLGPVFALRFAFVFGLDFHGSFSVGHCPGNCLFHWVFCDFGPLLSVLENSGSKCRLS
jgi:hypothetical protein